MEEVVVQLWMVGLALVALVALAARDVGRPGAASAGALLCLRAVGGLGLAAMAVAALAGGSPIAALVAFLGATPLLGGLVAPAVRARLGRRLSSPAAVRPAHERHYAPPVEERRAA